MPRDFVALILTHGRPDRVYTYAALRKSGYTGPIYLVVDDEDAALPEYQKRYPGEVLVFSKGEIAPTFDQGDNVVGLRGVVYARNASWKLARSVGARWFVQLDDDYSDFLFRLVGTRPSALEAGYHGWTMRQSLDAVFAAMVRFLETTGAASIAMSQGGDHVGGAEKVTDIRLTRKAMNSFVCAVERPFTFVGRINEDVNTYVALGNIGRLFFTYWPLQLNQTATQQAAGGMTELYLDGGTYLKSFYSVMFAPSCVRVEFLPKMRRLHHHVDWDRAVPKIIHERHRAEVSNGRR